MHQEKVWLKWKWLSRRTVWQKVPLKRRKLPTVYTALHLRRQPCSFSPPCGSQIPQKLKWVKATVGAPTVRYFMPQCAEFELSTSIRRVGRTTAYSRRSVAGIRTDNPFRFHVSPRVRQLARRSFLWCVLEYETTVSRRIISRIPACFVQGTRRKTWFPGL
jgi:hypothetical protein